MKYDVVIVGGGTAGTVLAARLSEDPKRSVLLLEAGPDYPDLDHLPDDLKYGYNPVASAPGAPHNWSLLGSLNPQRSEPTPLAQGKVLGGSSAINGQTMQRGLPEDFDNWASRGNDEWSYLKVLPYFRKMETDADIQDDFHGSSGPMPVRRYKREDWLPFQGAFYRSCIDAGFSEHPDMNHPESAGISPRTENNVGGIRMSTALAYINPIRHRLNLTIRPNVTASRIVFDGKRAAGVEVVSDGREFVVEGEQIILSSGAIRSPQLLMLSGIGPAARLRSLNIPVIQDVPGVGQNLMNHPSVGVSIRKKDGVSQDPYAPRHQLVLRYTSEGSKYHNDMMIIPASMLDPRHIDPAQGDHMRLETALHDPTSLGELTVTSSDFETQPKLELRYLTEEWDRKRLREAMRLCAQLLENQAFNDTVAARVSPTDQELASDQALDRWLINNVSTSRHFCGTCKMGPDKDGMAVVDQYCQVRGVDGLRVVDASVIPRIPRGGTFANTIMIGERVVEWIK